MPAPLQGRRTPPRLPQLDYAASQILKCLYTVSQSPANKQMWGFVRAL